MIKRIKIRDFKSIRDVDIQLDAITVLVGRSGTGKSNIVQAIRFLRNILLNPQQAITLEYGWERISPVGEKEPKTSIDVTFSIPGEERDYSYFIRFAARHHQNIQFQEESLALGGDPIFKRSYRITEGRAPSWTWDIAPQTASLPQQLEGPVLGNFPTLERVVYAYAALSNAIGYYHFPASILDPFRPPGDVHQTAQFFQNFPGLSDNASNYLDVIRRITQDFRNPAIRQNILASLKSVNPSIVSIELDSLMGPQRVIVGHRGQAGIFDLKLEQESDGLRRFYAHLLALYQTPPKLTLVFEEPENAIFPGALSLLADEFKAAPRENRGQVIFTTHNPLLLESFDVENVRVVDMHDGKTVVGPVSKEQRQAVRDHLLTTGELLTVERAKIDEPPNASPVP